MAHPELDPITLEALDFLQDILLANRDRRVVIVGPTCCGKSTLAQYIPGSVDMDKALFPLLSDDEVAYVCQDPWTPEVGEFMTDAARERLEVEPGAPIFGTVVLNADLVVHLIISDELLTSRAEARGVDVANAINMRNAIEQQLDSTDAEIYSLWLG